MRIGSLIVDGAARTAVLDGSELVEVEGTVAGLLATGAAERARLVAAGRRHPFAPERLGPAVPDPGKFLCIGKNYADHAAELGGVAPERPEVFMRSRTSLAGPYAEVRRPRVSDQMDFEVELAVVIGRSGRHIALENALEHVGGYAVFNDISIRDYQNFGKQWTPGKNFDGTGPLGPFVVTPDEAGDPAAFDLECLVVHEDGSEERLQSSNTSLMVHTIPVIIEFVSRWTTLEPGDVIATGTPGGVGSGRRPPRWLVPGETLVSRVAGLGELKNKVLDEGPGAPYNYAP